MPASIPAVSNRRLRERYLDIGSSIQVLFSVAGSQLCKFGSPSTGASGRRWTGRLPPASAAVPVSFMMAAVERYRVKLPVERTCLTHATAKDWRRAHRLELAGG